MQVLCDIQTVLLGYLSTDVARIGMRGGTPEAMMHLHCVKKLI
jgi:hypothetical protein